MHDAIGLRAGDLAPVKDADERPKDGGNVGGDKQSQAKLKEVNANVVWLSEWEED